MRNRAARAGPPRHFKRNGPPPLDPAPLTFDLALMPSTIAALPPFWTDRAGQFSALKFAAFCLCIGPALALAVMAATPGALGSKPLTFLIHETGELAVRFLLFSLAVTPLRTIADWPKLIMVRRMLGLTALFYVIAHVIFYVAEQAWNLPKVASEIVLRFYLTIGFVALLGLVALGVTSTDAMIKRIGAVRWNRLHALTYWITALALLHFFLQTRLDISVPVLMAGFFIWLMAWRWLKKRVEIGFGWMLALALFAALAAAGWKPPGMACATARRSTACCSPISTSASPSARRCGWRSPDLAWRCCTSCGAQAQLAEPRARAHSRPRTERTMTMAMSQTKTDFPFQLSDAEWRARLTPEQYQVLRGHGTERAGSCALNYEKRAGTFSCVGCGQDLFVGGRKFESGTGWPSFNDPLPGAVGTTTDRSWGMVRTEVHCSNCGGHLGHVFPDGPPPTGLRYCINGVALEFKPD